MRVLGGVCVPSQYLHSIHLIWGYSESTCAGGCLLTIYAHWTGDTDFDSVMTELLDNLCNVREDRVT